MNKFINKIKGGAIEGWKEYKILPSLTIAQAILESGWGKSKLAREGNNLFGIKAHGSPSYVVMRTREVYNGRGIYVSAKFRKYNSWESSVKGHTEFLKENKRYSNIINNKDYKEVCINIQKDGYATAPNYAENLTRIIEENKLYNIDKEAFSIFRKLEVQRGEDVKLIQQILYKLNLLNHLSGFYDMETRKAVVDYQSTHKGLDKTGIVDKATWNSLMVHK